MTSLDPRTRSLLRQADKIAAAGKRSAAVELYEKILDENPNADTAWSGLASVLADPVKKEESFEKALALNPENGDAIRGLATLRGEPIPAEWVIQEEVEEEEVGEETAVSETHEHEPVTNDDDLLLACYRHPNRETGLRCYNCQKPICMDCTRKTPVGYLCPDCYREKEDIFFNAKNRDYIVAPIIAFPLSLIAGFLALQVGSFFGIFIFFLAAAVGGGIGGLIGRLAKRAVGYRRGRYLPHTVSAMVILGFLIPSLPAVLLGSLGAILVPGILLFFATGAAFYAMR
ncbi:MAG: hypothetical protein AAF490_24760 [Chloroflexota bacterium]